MIFRNLLRNRRRSILMGITIASVYMGLLLMFAYVDRVDEYLKVAAVYINHSGHVRVYKKHGLENYFNRPRRYFLNEEEIAKIQSLTLPFAAKIEKISPYLEGLGLASNGCQYRPFKMKSFTAEQDHWVRSHPMVQQWTPELLKMSHGKPLAEGNPENTVLLTSKLASLLSKPQVISETGPVETSLQTDCQSPNARAQIAKTADLILMGQSFDGGLNAVDAEIGGQFQTGLALAEDSGLQMTLPMAQNLYGISGATYLGIYLKDGLGFDAIRDQLNERFKIESLDFEAHSFDHEKISLFYTGTMRFLYAMAAFFFLLISIVIVISLSSSVSMNIFDRIRELATLRAVGFSSWQISSMMAEETLLLTALGTTVGYGLALLISFLVNQAGLRYAPPGIAGDMQFVLIVGGLRALELALPVFLIAFGTSCIVTRQKMKSKISQLLTE